MVKKVEAVTPPETVAKLLGAAGADLVLVGGQALAFWANRYGVWQPRPHVPAVSNDVDFLARSAGDKSSVHRLADVIHGQTVFPSKHDRSALVGQAVLDVSPEKYVNVDVIFRIIGLEGDTVRQRAVKATSPGGYVSAIEKMAAEDAGRKVAKRHGLHVADAIDPTVIPAGPFWTKRWPGLRSLMSQSYSASIQPPSPNEHATRRARDRTERG